MSGLINLQWFVLMLHFSTPDAGYVAKTFLPVFPARMSRRRNRHPGPSPQPPPAHPGEQARHVQGHSGRPMTDNHDVWMTHILYSMVADGHARQVVQVYLRAMRAGENAEQVAVNLISKLRPGLTLAEPAEMLERLLAWVAAEHGQWWRKALLRPPPLHDLSLREMYRRGWIIQASCTRHSEATINYSVVLAEHLMNRVDPPVHDALAKLRCPKCHMRVDGAKVVRLPAIAESFLARATRHRR